MTTLFGCTCNQPLRLMEALEPVRDRLVAEGPVPRWGLGYVQSGQVLLSRTPRLSDDDVDLYAALERLRADYVIAHASADDGFRGSANTQPFRFRRWMFAAKDDALIDGFESVQPSMLEHIPDFLRRTLKGKTPAEHVFHLFLSFLHDAGHVDDVNLDAATARRALRDTLALVLSLLTRTGGGGAPGNIILSNGRLMLAVRMEELLCLRRLKAAPAKKEPETFKGVLALSSPQHPGEGFEEIPKRSVLEISRNLNMEIVDLDG